MKKISKCIECKKEFPQKRAWQKYCSDDCRLARWLRLNPRIKIEEGVPNA
jgi:hypothetical protein